MSVPVLLISMLIFFVLFFGIGFLLNMLLRMSWIMAILYPIVVIIIVGKGKIRFADYFTAPSSSFNLLKDIVNSLAPADILILTSGFSGAILAGIIIRMLRSKGYQMF